MKKYIYIGLFMWLSFMLSMLVHAGLEMPALTVMSRELAAGEPSFLATHWKLIHGGGGKVLSILGIALGFFLGKRFWQILYVEKRYGEPKL